MPTSPYPIIPIETALAMIAREITPMPIVSMPFQEAVGLVLAEDIQATESLPPFPSAAVDGYAVQAADGNGWRTLVGDQLAGTMADLTVAPGTAARVMTGAPIPHGADAMVMVEDSVEEGDKVNLTPQWLEPGAYIRPVGEDIQTGQLVLAAGTPLGPAELGLLATIGQTKVSVYRPPVVAVMSTGDELVEPDQPLKPGQIRDANRFTMMAMVRSVGAIAIDMGIVRDQEGGVEKAIETALQQADVLLTSGGVSMGQRDLVKPYLDNRGTLYFGRVNTKPGKPVTFAKIDGRACFALPGFPVSAMVCFEIFVRPALRQMLGHSEIYRPREQATLRHNFKHNPERTEFQRVILTRQADGRLVAESTGFQGSGRLLSMRGANGFVILPHGQADFEAGTDVEAVLLETV